VEVEGLQFKASQSQKKKKSNTISQRTSQGWWSNPEIILEAEIEGSWSEEKVQDTI
jgi:hypothetical protein